MPYSLRPLSTDDAALYRTLRLEALASDPAAFGASHEEESAYPLAWFQERLANNYVLGSFIGGSLCGCAGFYIGSGIKMAHKGTLWGMYVRPAARQQGVGKTLVKAVLEAAQTQVEQIDLCVNADNHAAIQLYQHFGFSAYGTERHATKYNGIYADEIMMVKFF